MCTVLQPPGGYPIAVNKYIISYHTKSHHKILGQTRVSSVVVRRNESVPSQTVAFPPSYRHTDTVCAAYTELKNYKKMYLLT